MQNAVKRGLQRGQGMMKPPAVGSADAVLSCGAVIKDEDGQHLTARGSGAERRIVGKPQILAKPADGEKSRCLLYTSPSPRDTA